MHQFCEFIYTRNVSQVFMGDTTDNESRDNHKYAVNDEII